MTSKNLYIAIFVGLAVAIVGFIIGTALLRYQSEAGVPDCPEGTTPSFHPGECRELLPIELDETFPWDRQQAEAKDFFRQFQRSVSEDRRREVAGMMMYPLRVLFFTDPKAADYRFLNSPAELLDVYDEVFHKSVKEYIAGHDANNVLGNDYFLQTGNGQIGIYCTTHGECPACSFDFKVKIIRSNSIYREGL
jgi:hypothetical protein